MGVAALTNSAILDNAISDVNGIGIAFGSGNTVNLVSGNIVLNSGSDGIQVAAGATGNTFKTIRSSAAAGSRLPASTRATNNLSCPQCVERK